MQETMSATSGTDRADREGGPPPPAEAEEEEKDGEEEEKDEAVVVVEMAFEEAESLVRKGSSGAEQ